MRKLTILILCMSVALAACAKKELLRYPATPWVTDLDRYPIQKPKIKKKDVELEYADRRIYQSFEQIVATGDMLVTLPGAAAFGIGGEALNTNNFDEVADSTWFTNRIGRGIQPVFNTAPPIFGKTVPVLAVLAGSSPRLFVRDASGSKVILKFDDSSAPGMATGSEFIAGRLLFAAGYNVPESCLIDFDLSSLAPTRDSKFAVDYTHISDLSADNLKTAILQITGGKKGPVRALALKLPGEFVGPFSFAGRRGGDKNDRISHENRRELRGYKIFSSFINNTNSLVAETMDFFFPTTRERGYLEHYLFDLSSAFEDASGKLVPEDPLLWTSRYPNRAFNLMTGRDAFWAANILYRLPDKLIEQIVESAGFPDKKTTKNFIKSLKYRRDRIVSYWFGRIPPIVDISLEPGPQSTTAGFKNLSTEEKLHYRYQLSSYTGRQKLIFWTTSDETSITIDNSIIQKMHPHRLYTLRLQTKRTKDKWWSPSIDLFIMKKGGKPVLLGFKRRYNR